MVAESLHNIQRATNPSSTRLVHGSDPVPTLAERNRKAEAEDQRSPFNVEDKVDLQLESEAIRQLKPNTHLKFLISDESNRVIVQIIQSDTNEVLREVPPKSLSDALAALNSGFSKK